MDNEIEKPEQPNPEDILTAITSFNDPSIIINIFKELGWSYTFEIKEWLMLARQNANLAVKSKALIQLRKLLREAAETSGLIANVSSTMPNAQGGHTTFQAKRIAGALNPVKKIESTEIKEPQNDKKETQTEPNRGSDREQNTAEENGTRDEGRRPPRQNKSSDSPEPIRDSRCAFPAGAGDAESGGTEPQNSGETPGAVPGGASPNDGNTDNNCVREDGECPAGGDAPTESPCIKTRPPTCNQDLFPGISSAGD